MNKPKYIDIAYLRIIIIFKNDLIALHAIQIHTSRRLVLWIGL